MSEYININNIYISAAWNNKKIIVSMILLLAAYYLRDVKFTRSIASVTSNIPVFIADVDLNKFVILLLPYIGALILMHISNILYAESLPNIQLESVSNLIDKIIISIKKSKNEININDLIVHIKTFAESGKFYKVMVSNILPTFVIIIGVIYNMICADVKYGLIIGIIIICLILITTKLEYDNVFATHDAEKSMNGLFDEIHEILSNIDTIVTSNTEQKERESIENIKKEVYKISSYAKNSTSITTSEMQFGSFIIAVMICYYSYYLYVNKYIDITILIANIMMSILFMDNYNKMLAAIGSVMGETGAFLELIKYFGAFQLTTNNEMLIENNKGELQVSSGNIHINNISLKRKNNIVFKNLNLEIKGNQITGIIGPIGSGKSSLMKIITGILDYDGDIIIDNQNIKQCKHESVLKHIIYIPQHPILFNKSLYHNITYGSTHDKDSVNKILKELDLLTFFNSFPQGLDTIAGKGGSNLSGGQKQMIALIRSLLQNKKIILLDEPSSSLDNKNKQIFMNLVKKLKNKTIIINTHDDKLFEICDKIINIDHIKNK